MTKLTLSVDEVVLEQAKRLAEANNTSVSAMFSQFVRSMAAGGGGPEEIGALTGRAAGMAKLPPGEDYKRLLAEALSEKYGVAK